MADEEAVDGRLAQARNANSAGNGRRLSGWWRKAAIRGPDGSTEAGARTEQVQNNTDTLNLLALVSWQEEEKKIKKGAGKRATASGQQRKED